MCSITWAISRSANKQITEKNQQLGKWSHRWIKQWLDRDGCFQKYGYPQIIHFNRVFHYKPSILGYPYFWKHPHRWIKQWLDRDLNMIYNRNVPAPLSWSLPRWYRTFYPQLVLVLLPPPTPLQKGGFFGRDKCFIDTDVWYANVIYGHDVFCLCIVCLVLLVGYHTCD